jgi:anti-anti-sigma factor
MVLAATGRACTVGAVESRPGDAPYMPTGTIELQDEAGGPVLHMHGDIDAPVLQRWEEEGEPVDRLAITAVDVSEMAYIDSIGLSFLVRWAQARSSAGQPAVIRKASPRFEQVLHIAGIGSLFVRDE